MRYNGERGHGAREYLPPEWDKPPNPAVEVDSKNIVCTTRLGGLPIATASAVSESPRDPTAVVIAPRRILVVDDNRDGADSLTKMLRMLNNKVQTVYDGIAALQQAEVFRPDVVLDIGLPKLNGYEVARRIRREAWGEAMILIAVTGWGQDDDKRRSQEAGFNFHMVKPVNPRDFDQLLSGLLPPS